VDHPGCGEEINADFSGLENLVRHMEPIHRLQQPPGLNSGAFPSRSYSEYRGDRTACARWSGPSTDRQSPARALVDQPTVPTANAVLIRKTVAANACIQTVEKAFEVVGGGAFFRSLGLERLLRDVHGAQFHPLQEKRQHLFTGRVALGLDPVG
jgi:Acyl-CoA dehydrogenase, C-terminal domain